jgi:L-2-hydroxyglutarate oxidase LhgO
VDALVIGAGVIGLAVARALAMAGMETVIAERGPQFGMETSSRNSEVIHAGIYYPPASFKARMCLEGRRVLYEFCEARGVPHRRCGKLVVATHGGQVGALESIMANAVASGVDDLAWLDGDGARAREPDIVCERAIFSPSTGIIDSHAYMLALLGETEAHGAILACNTEVNAIRPVAGGWAVHIAGVAIEGMPAAAVPVTRYAKGCYFSYGERTRFRHLVYPAPEPGGLGTHLTLDLAGAVRFGPDVEWIVAPDYGFPPDRHGSFLAAIRQFWPGVCPENLHPAYVGIRPKLAGPSETAADFRFDGPAEHGLPGVFHLFGIESPGLTSSLAIADHVRAMAAGE